MNPRGFDNITIANEKTDEPAIVLDPGNNVLATTLYPAERAPLGSEVIMPVTWTRRHGKGRVFYTSLGHDAATLGLPPVLTMATRGLLWAAGVL